jgi:deoxyribodipyrimidine photo-lyase
MSGNPATIVWLRQDLRLADNPALDAAARNGGPVVPVFIWSPEEEGAWGPGAASKVFLHHALASLAAGLRKLGSRLILRCGPAGPVLGDLRRDTRAAAVYWNRVYEPVVSRRDKQLKDSLRDSGLDARSFQANLLLEPWQVQNQSGRPFQVFTPFYKRCMQLYQHVPPLTAPDALPAPEGWPQSQALEELGLLPALPWDVGITEQWEASETAAQRRLAKFATAAAAQYAVRRDRTDQDGTSRLSPYLHWGMLSPRQVWEAAQPAEEYIRQLWWREFAHHLLVHFPHTPESPLRPEFARFPWRQDRRALRAWQRGRTGYPFIDAAMRQLWQTGWMHNRARMGVASFLVKHLLLPWQQGEAWFWDTLVDADLANNTLGWQWTAGCGADAAPYFRIFNPTLQGRKFDPDGAYIRRYVPELAGLPARSIHEPWNASSLELAAADVRLGETYPLPIVEHGFARNRALAALATIKRMAVAAAGN